MIEWESGSESWVVGPFPDDAAAEAFIQSTSQLVASLGGYAETDSLMDPVAAATDLAELVRAHEETA